ncbi:glycoside hydrolase family 16 protein [Micromonospora sp. KC721]|uniref:glycoside hydrolase family 16 protein n=1 Tax=Micromonospora sp. KC721 TaxID=2530380 RepID=UPI00104595D3|nr:glycoside hydrolase family 16 protein [Micromonospora sp. KC721]TDB72351.1 glycoside hydrolase family 16 protein [Micromonospora sp. KC721]
MSRPGLHRAVARLGARRRAAALGMLSVGVVAAVAATMMPLGAAEVPPAVLTAVADTTVSQVPQDGDNGVKTTLASCPELCDGNRTGRRDALVGFVVRGVPADAVRIRATLRMYTWQPAAARIRVHPVRGSADGPGGWERRPVLGAAVAGREQVTAGFNEFDVSAAVTGNGPVSFALVQETRHSRIYWASRENGTAAVRPQLVLAYQRGSGGPPAGGPAPPGASATFGARPAPLARPTAPRVPSPGPVAPPTSPPTTSPPTTSPPTANSPVAPAPVPGSEVPGWRLVWSDEFDGPTLDRSKWNLRDNEGRDIDRGCNVDEPENTFVSGGVLTLRAQRETVTCGSQTREYTQSYLDTIGRHSFRYGRFEVRARSPNRPVGSRGLWPAFWLRPEDGGRGEIDVVELPGGSDWYQAATLAIFYDYSPVKQDVRYAFPVGYPGDGFHTYTTEWEPDAIRWYVDGRLVWQRDRATTPWFDEVFHKPYNLRLNVQVGGWLGNPDPATRFPADFRVDYVRVWQR